LICCHDIKEFPEIQSLKRPQEKLSLGGQVNFDVEGEIHREDNDGWVLWEIKSQEYFSRSFLLSC